MKTKTISEYLFEYFAKNQERLDKDYPGIQFQRFLDEYCAFDNSKASDDFFMLNPGFLEKIRLGTPFEYINFSSFFYKEEFYVNQDVLIPRSETEILCERAIEFIEKNYHENFSVYDIGTGSGIIPLTIATEIKKKVSLRACDISSDALEVANINYDNLFQKIHRDSRVIFELRDRMEGLEGEFDLITSNPPYIKKVIDQEQVHHQADSFEPHIALYLDDESYNDWFETLFEQVRGHLKSEGIFIMEGHEDHLEELSETSRKYFIESDIIKDYTQRNRFIICSKPKI